MAYNPQTGTWEGPTTSTSGLDPNAISRNTVAPKWSNTNAAGGDFSFGTSSNTPYLQSYGQDNTTYSGEGGNWTSTNGGAWTGANGQTVNDLAGYLKMKKNQATGSDFSGFQTGLNSTLNNNADLQSRYKQLLDDPSKIQQTAGYQFDLEQGNQAVNRSAAAKGMLNSGNVLAELAKFGQGLASKEYGNQLNYLNQGIQSTDASANTFGNLIKNAQDFGVNSGYYENPTNQYGGQTGQWGGPKLTTRTRG